MDNGGKVNTLIKNGTLKRPILNRWITENKLFKAHWDDIINGTMRVFKMSMLESLEKVVDNLDRKLDDKDIGIYENVAAGKFIKEMIEDSDDALMEGEEKVVTTFDSDGRVLSVTEQRSLTHKIRERRRINNNPDE